MTAMARWKLSRGRERKNLGILAREKLELSLSTVEANMPEGHQFLIGGEPGCCLRGNVDRLCGCRGLVVGGRTHGKKVVRSGEPRALESDLDVTHLGDRFQRKSY